MCPEADMGWCLPVPVRTPVSSRLQNVVMIVTGAVHSLALVLLIREREKAQGGSGSDGILTVARGKHALEE